MEIMPQQINKIPEPVATETAGEYGRRVHAALNQPACACPKRYSVCRWISYHQRTFTDIWHTAKSGRARIRLHGTATDFEVYALDGHNLLPRTRSFPRLADAKAYANLLWETI